MYYHHKFIPVLIILILLATYCMAAWPTIQTYPTVSSSTLVANNSTLYTVTTTISDADGYNDINCIRILFNYTEANPDQTKARGYLAWGIDEATITKYGGIWYTFLAGGTSTRWGYATDIWGGLTYITPVGFQVTTSGSASGAVGTRTATWSFRVKQAWAVNPLINDVDVWVSDASGNIIGWKDNPSEFNVVSTACSTYAPTPNPPIVGNATAGSLDVSIAPQDSNADLFCIRVSPKILGKEFVQADGAVGTLSFHQSKSAWGTKTVTGLSSGTAYTFKVQAIGATSGSCPSPWSGNTITSTSTLIRPVNSTGPGIPIHKGIAGMDIQPKSIGAQRLSDNLAVCFNTTLRFGGDGYNWKTRTAEWNSSTVSTLKTLRDARDRNSNLQMCTNTRGIGTGNGSTWSYTDQTAEILAALTADWVYYCNKLLQTKRQGDSLTAYEQSLLNSMSWGTDEKLLKVGETPVPNVEYWEIGNEPEGPFPPPALTPTDYAARYSTISQAMVAVDPDIKVGPCVMSADNGNAWLDAVFSNPANKVDFVAYHPYGPLYSLTKSSSGGVLNADDLNTGLNSMKQQQVDRRLKVVQRLAANNRPADTPLIASEWNPSSWEGTYYFSLNRTMAHALGIAETMFTFAELSFVAAQYWDLVNYPSNSAVENPGFKAYKAFQKNNADRLIDSYMEIDFRIYTTLNSSTDQLVTWILNFSEYMDKPVTFNLPSDLAGASVVAHKLGAVNGNTSLITLNSSSEQINWMLTDVTRSTNPSSFTVTSPRATLMMIVIDKAYKSLSDGSRVNLSGKCVTAVHPSNGYLYIEEDDRSFGIRVTGNCSGISIGDRVSVAGTIETRKPDGVTPCERYIAGESVIRASGGNPLPPLGMNCRAIGGEGVNGGDGLNNIGLLIRTAGKVTEVLDSEHFYLDDGSNIPDVTGKTGVLVRCPSTISISVGNTVMVTGVIEGDVPDGWTTSRRYIRVRTQPDVIMIR